ncbi:MAG: hypothetical protein ACREJC_06835, partial [Tepidisphaeraceae bacterium]
VPADEADVRFYAMSYVDALGFSRPDLLVVLRKWIPEIARYSFREVRMQRISVKVNPDVTKTQAARASARAARS